MLRRRHSLSRPGGQPTYRSLGQNRRIRKHWLAGDRGFVLPMVVGLGLLMLLIAIALLIRTQTQQVTASAQRSSESSVAIAELGVARVQNFFGQYRGLALEPFPWSGNSSSVLDRRSCTSTSYPVVTAANAFNNEIAAGDNQGQFNIVSYTPPTSLPGNGTLVLRGDTRRGTEINASTQLQVRIPISREVLPAENAPMVWARVIDFGGTGVQVTGSATYPIIKFGCQGSMLAALGGSRISTGSQTQDDPAKSLPVTPLSAIAVPSDAIPLPSPIGAGNLTDGGGASSFFSSLENRRLTLPRATTLSADAPAGTTTLSLTAVSGLRSGMKLRIGTDATTYTVGSIPATTLTANANTGSTAIAVASTSGLTVGSRLQIGTAASTYTVTAVAGSTLTISPDIQSGQQQVANAPVYQRALTITPALGSAQAAGAVVAEPASPQGEYVYTLDSLNLSNTAGSQIAVQTGTKVILYVNANINTGSSSTNPKILHDCTSIIGCKPTDFKLIARSTSSTDSVMLGNNNQVVDGFIFAPNLSVSLAGQIQWRGGIWADVLNLAANTAVLAPLDLAWAEIQTPLPPPSSASSLLPPSLGSPTVWVREEVS
jgi:hypothetical protein